MTDPIKIMDEIERAVNDDSPLLITVLTERWQSLRTAIEAQQARIARLEKAAQNVTECLAGQVPVYLEELEATLDESPAQSHAAVKAEALREFSDSIDIYDVGAGIKRHAEMRATELEREAKEES